MTALILPPDSPVKGTGTDIINDNGQLRVAGMLTRAEFIEIERIRNSQWYLVRNDGGQMGERAPCLRSKSQFDKGHYHDYFTAMCVERPFRGIERGLEVWLKASSDHLRRSALLAGMTRGLEDYAKNHPQTASILKPADPDTVAWYTMLAGTHIPITTAEARRYAQKIKDRRPPSMPPELLSLLRPSAVVLSSV
jgi:hypothetical protein